MALLAAQASDHAAQKLMTESDRKVLKRSLVAQYRRNAKIFEGWASGVLRKSHSNKDSNHLLLCEHPSWPKTVLHLAVRGGHKDFVSEDYVQQLIEDAWEDGPQKLTGLIADRQPFATSYRRQRSIDSDDEEDTPRVSWMCPGMCLGGYSRIHENEGRTQRVNPLAWAFNTSACRLSPNQTFRIRVVSYACFLALFTAVLHTPKATAVLPLSRLEIGFYVWSFALVADEIFAFFFDRARISLSPYTLSMNLATLGPVLVALNRISSPLHQASVTSFISNSTRTPTTYGTFSMQSSAFSSYSLFCYVCLPYIATHVFWKGVVQLS